MRKIIKIFHLILQALKELSNTYYYTSITKAAVYNVSNTLCSLKLPKGYTYLVLGNVSVNVDVDSLVIATLSGTSGEVATGRTTMRAGSGCHCWALMDSVETEQTITLNTHGYYNGKYSFTGKLLAIKLGIFSGGGYRRILEEFRRGGVCLAA